MAKLLEALTIMDDRDDRGYLKIFMDVHMDLSH